MIFGQKTQQKPQTVVLGSTKRVPDNHLCGEMPRSVSLLTLILCVAFLGSALFVAVTYKEHREAVAEMVTLRAQAEVQFIVSRVARLIDVPADEEPLVARVSDPAQLPKDPFFSPAAQGDRILVYCHAQKSILYSPTRDKLIGVYPQALPGVCQ